MQLFITLKFIYIRTFVLNIILYFQKIFNKLASKKFWNKIEINKLIKKIIIHHI